MTKGLERAHLAELATAASAFAAASMSENTRRVYAHAWGAFVEWCEAYGVRALPVRPGNLAIYLTELAAERLSASSIDVALAAIAKAHRAAGHPSPRDDERVRAVRVGIRRTVGVAGTPRRALVSEALKRCLDTCDDSRIGVRDRAVLLVGWAAALRRSELCALDVSDVTRTSEGAVLRIRRSKSDQEGHGTGVAIVLASDPKLCPVAALDTWMLVLGSRSGPLFVRLANETRGKSGARLKPAAIWAIVRRRVELAGLPPSEYGAHSLRSGFVTSAARAGASERSIMRHTRHTSTSSLRRYIHEATPFDDHPGKGLL